MKYSNKRYHTLDYYYKKLFGSKVFKVSLDGGFTCPNIDGTVGVGGCIYCSSFGSGDFAGDRKDSLDSQFKNIRDMMKTKWDSDKYIAYFQANTNTYASLDILKNMYEEVLSYDGVVGISISTRPDSISNEVLNYLEELNSKTLLTVELGLQTIHENTSNFINRCHSLTCFEKMVIKLRKLGINVVVHIINGLPYENKKDMLDTVKYLNKLDINGIKIHMLHVLKRTKLASIYKNSPFSVLTLVEYVDIVCDQLELLRDDIVIHRITGDGNPADLIAPLWTKKKFVVLNEIDKELTRRGTYQGFNSSILKRVKLIMDRVIKKKDIVVDCTVGNGRDALYMIEKLDGGFLFGFDIQNIAITKTKELLSTNDFSNFKLFLESHENVYERLLDYTNKVSLIVYNLGYFPGGDKSVTTNYKEVIKSVCGSYKLLNNKGVILIVVYPGHKEGFIESEKLMSFLTNNNFLYKIYKNTDNINAPYLIQIKK